MKELLRRLVADATTIQELADALEQYLEIVEFMEVDGKERIVLRLERAVVKRFGSSRIAIRPKEQCHNIEHFHFTGPDVNASFRIDNCELLVGEVDRQSLKKIKRFFNEGGGRQKLYEFWQATRPIN